LVFTFTSLNPEMGNDLDYTFSQNVGALKGCWKKIEKK